MSQSLETFHVQFQILLKLLQAADVVANIKLDDMRGTNSGTELARKLISGDAISSLRYSKYVFMSEEERKAFEANGYIQDMCNQIALHSYTLLETYLRNIFEEFLAYRVSDNVLKGAILKKLSFRNLRSIKENFCDFLGVKIHEFDHDQVPIYEDSVFKANTCWEGISLLSKIRNEVAHTGKSMTISLNHLVDAYSIMEFVQLWIILFDANHDENSVIKSSREAVRLQ